MNPIKFRVWDKTHNGFMRSYKDRGLLFNHLSDEDMDDWGGFGLGSILDNYPNLVVQQFTGLYDSDGKEIYDGDIVNARKPNSYLGGNYIVAWHKDKGRWYYTNQPSFKDLYQVGCGGNIKCFVVGNIFQNMDLTH